MVTGVTLLILVPCCQCQWRWPWPWPPASRWWWWWLWWTLLIRLQEHTSLLRTFHGGFCISGTFLDPHSLVLLPSAASGASSAPLRMGNVWQQCVTLPSLFLSLSLEGVIAYPEKVFTESASSSQKFFSSSQQLMHSRTLQTRPSSPGRWRPTTERRTLPSSSPSRRRTTAAAASTRRQKELCVFLEPSEAPPISVCCVCRVCVCCAPPPAAKGEGEEEGERTPLSLCRPPPNPHLPQVLFNARERALDITGFLDRLSRRVSPFEREDPRPCVVIGLVITHTLHPPSSSDRAPPFFQVPRTNNDSTRVILVRWGDQIYCRCC